MYVLPLTKFQPKFTLLPRIVENGLDSLLTGTVRSIRSTLTVDLMEKEHLLAPNKWAVFALIWPN